MGQSCFYGVVCTDLEERLVLLWKISILRVHTVSISITVRKAFSERPEIGAKKLPAAPIEVEVRLDAAL